MITCTTIIISIHHLQLATFIIFSHTFNMHLHNPHPLRIISGSTGRNESLTCTVCMCEVPLVTFLTTHKMQLILIYLLHKWSDCRVKNDLHHYEMLLLTSNLPHKRHKQIPQACVQYIRDSPRAWEPEMKVNIYPTPHMWTLPVYTRCTYSQCMPRSRISMTFEPTCVD